MAALRPAPGLLHLITSLNIGGTERYLVELCAAQQSRWEIRVGYMKVRGPTAEDLERLGIEVEHLPGMRAIHRSLRSRPVSVLHTHLYRANVLGRITGAMAGVPVILSSQHSIGSWRRRPHSLADRWSARFARRIVADSEAARAVLIEREGIPAHKVEVIHSSAVDPDRFHPSRSAREVRSELGLGLEVPLFGCVARLHPAKGVHHLPALAAEIGRLEPAARIVVAGEGPSRTGLEEELRRTGQSERVRLLGWRSDVPDLLGAFDAFFLVSEEESFPRTILEAMVVGCPVVAPDLGGIGEVLVSGEHGRLVPPGRMDLLAASLVAVIRDRSDATSLAEAARRRVLAGFTLTPMLQQTRDLYARCLREAELP